MESNTLNKLAFPAVVKSTAYSPFVSIIIPAFNEELHIEEALNCALAQKYSSFEIIVVDNNSSDRTAPIVQQISKKYPVRLVHEGNKGTMWACERGRKESRGEIIVRMDADCLPEENWLQNGVRHFIDPKVAVVSGPYNYYDGSLSFRLISFYTQKYFFWFMNAVLSAFKLGGITLGGNTFMRASALQSAGGFNTSITFYGDDTDVPKRLLPYGKCVFDRDLTLKTSSRRYYAIGIIRLTFRYWKHFFKIIFGL